MVKLEKSLLRLSQTDSAQFIIDTPKCGIFSDMGFGKTVATTTAIEKLFRLKETNKVLIVSTLLVARETWPQELQDWEHTSYLRFSILAGDDAETRLKKAKQDADIYIINQENFVWLVEKAGKRWPFDMVVFDDAEGFKSSDRFTKPSKACALSEDCPIYEAENSFICKKAKNCQNYKKAKIGESCAVPCKEFLPVKGGSKACVVYCDNFKAPPRSHTRYGALMAIMPQVKRLVHLTGTPSSKGLLDLWPLISTIDNGKRLGRTYTAYKMAYFNRSHNGFGWELKPESEVAIHEKLKDICIYIESEAKLPPLKSVHVPIKLPPKAAKMYDDFERDLLVNLESDEELIAANNGVLAGKLLQVCGGAVYYNAEKDWEEIHDEKLKALDKILEKHRGEPVLVGFNFKHELERLKTRYPHGVDIRERKDAIHAWNAGDIPLMFAHPKSAGHGLNLQRGPGRTLVWFGLNWRLDFNKQLNKRLWRPGQARECFIYYIVAEGRADTTLMQGVAKYDWTQQKLLEAVKRQAQSKSLVSSQDV